MTSQRQEFDFEMACDGCYNAAKRVLEKIGVTQVDADVPKHKLWVTTDKTSDEILIALVKTGKKASYVGVA